MAWVPTPFSQLSHNLSVIPLNPSACRLAPADDVFYTRTDQPKPVTPYERVSSKKTDGSNFGPRHLKMLPGS